MRFTILLILVRIKQAFSFKECYKESLGYTCRHRPGECGGPR